MSEPTKPVVVMPRFMDRLFEIEQYLGRDKPSRGRAFVSDLFDFLHEVIGPMPLAFPAYVLPRHPELPLRRAVFRKEYIVLYEVKDTEAVMLTIFTARSNPQRVEL